jgi:hypothetical protein
MASLPKQRHTAKRRRLSFSLRTLLILTTLASIVLGVGGNILLRARRQRALVARIESLSGSVVYDFELGDRSAGKALVRHWGSWLLGKDAVASVVHVGLQPLEAEHDLSWLRELPEIEQLELKGPFATDDDLEQIVQLKKLQRLRLSGTPLAPRGLRAVAAAPALRSLAIEGVHLDSGLAQGLGALTQLESLILQTDGIDSDHLSELRALQQLSNLEIGGAVQIDDRALENLGQLKSLVHLTLKRTSIRGRQWAQLDGLDQLQTLIICESPLEDSTWDSFPLLPSLTSLHVSDTGAGDIAARRIAQLPRLETLYLSRSRLSDRGLAALARAPLLTNLNVEGTYVTPAGLSALAQLTSLRYLAVAPGIRESQALALVYRLPPSCVIVGSDGAGRALFEVRVPLGDEPPAGEKAKDDVSLE